ncbi:hypothetical protein K9M79_06895 [Candidatus Woesearchaeota archaeon]|nr:hypothetical protein [Candidatus Woesearchaeota archaeon]
MENTTQCQEDCIDQLHIESEEAETTAENSLAFATVVHLEGQLRFPDKRTYDKVNSQLKEIIDLFSEYDALITIESETPYIEAAEKYGNNMLSYALEHGHGVGIHCDFDSMSQEQATEAYRTRKKKLI